MTSGAFSAWLAVATCGREVLKATAIAPSMHTNPASAMLPIYHARAPRGQRRKSDTEKPATSDPASAAYIKTCILVKTATGAPGVLRGDATRKDLCSARIREEGAEDERSGSAD